METSLFLAQLFGVWFLVAGVGLWLNRSDFKKLVDDFSKSPALVYTMAMFILGVGILLVLSHNVWEGGWPVIITVLAWGTAIKGAAYLLWPKETLKFAKSFVSAGVMNWACLLTIVLGGYLTYVGFGLG
jgi:hypothetical protein